MKSLTKTSLEKLPPHNLEAEQAILGAILLAPQESLHTLRSSGFEVSDFYRDSHRKIYQACQAIMSQGEQEIDLLVLRDALARDRVLDEIGGPVYLAALVDVVPSAANILYHARIVREKALLRKLLNASMTLATRAYDDTEEYQQLINEAKDQIDGIYRQIVPQNGAGPFWTHDNFGRANGIDEYCYLLFLAETFGFAMVQMNESVLFVRKCENILKETVWHKSINKTIKDMLNDYCHEHDRLDIWRCLLEKGAKMFSYTSLTGLSTLENTFLRDTEDTCYLFFQNGVIQVKATSVDFLEYDQLEGYVWEGSISEHDYFGKYHLNLEDRLRKDLHQSLKAGNRFRVNVIRRILANMIWQRRIHHLSIDDHRILSIMTKMQQDCLEAQGLFLQGNRFDLSDNEAQELAILYEYTKIYNEKKSEYQQFLEYVSRESIEDYNGKYHHVDNLHAFEFALAHLVSLYNDPVNMRAVVLADSNPAFVSDGRRGKKIVLDALKHLRGKGCVVKEDGKAYDAGRFKFQRVQPNTKIIILDDVSEEFDFKSLYSAITDQLVVESKGITRFAFNFEDNPKFALTTNHPCYDEDISSTERSILLPISDYFVRQGRTPYQVFGHRLYDDWDQQEWNRFFDYFISIIQKYLQRPDPSIIPISDLTIFNANKLLLKVPEPMVNYLDDLPKGQDHHWEEVRLDIENVGIKFRSSKEFSKLLHTYCRLRGYKMRSNTKDGRYIIDSTRYLCLLPVTPDLPGLKYEKPKPKE